MSNLIMFLGFILLYLLLIWKSGKTYPIFYLFLFTYFLQYIFSTYFVYNEYEVLSYQMPIDQEMYFDYAIPALFFLFLGVFLFMKDFPVRALLKRIKPQQANQMGYLLLGISLAFDFIQLLGINALNSIGSFTDYFKYLAAFCFLFARSTLNYILIFLIYLQLAFIVLSAGVFISFFMWSTFFFFFAVLTLRVPFWLRASFIIVAIPVTVLIQSVKNEYRKMTWQGQREGSVELFSELADKNAEESEGPYSESKGVVSTVGRLSQGWHLGITLNYVPSSEPFANGKEMLNDIVSSILPRIIFSEKKEVNSKEKFFKYTGHRLMGTTSMSIGLLGDFYINFGRWGSFIMLFVFGAVIAKLLNYFYERYVIRDPLNVIWIPFILSYLIRANNDFYIFFNCMVKGFLIFLVMNYLRQNLFPARKKNRTPVYKEIRA